MAVGNGWASWKLDFSSGKTRSPRQGVACRGALATTLGCWRRAPWTLQTLPGGRCPAVGRGAEQGQAGRHGDAGDSFSRDRPSSQTGPGPEVSCPPSGVLVSVQPQGSGQRGHAPAPWPGLASPRACGACWRPCPPAGLARPGPDPSVPRGRPRHPYPSCPKLWRF